MNYLTFGLALSWVALSSVTADILPIGKPLSLKKDISTWHYSLSEKVLDNAEFKKTGLVECAELEELQGVVLCAATKKAYMNKILTRASLFSEGSVGLPKGQVVSTDSKAYLSIVSAALGHDIPSPALLGFWSALEQSCQQKNQCPTPEEEEMFKEVILPFSQKGVPFVVISYAIDTEWYVGLSHEVLHAQYFLDTRFRETVDEFWEKSLQPQHQNTIRQILGKDYNQSDEFVMRNEFQAYLMQSHAHEDRLKDFVPLYQAALIKKLTEAGVSPLTQ